MSTDFLVRHSIICGIMLALTGPARAQAPAPEPPPLWETQVGASFVGTSGNTETSTVGADFSLTRRWRVWQIESGAAAIRTTDHDVLTAERYLAGIRGKRQLTAILGLSAGERVERDPLAGTNFRSIFDGGLSWALVRSPRWTVDGLTALPGFKKSDNTTTASLVLRWKAATPAP